MAVAWKSLAISNFKDVWFAKTMTLICVNCAIRPTADIFSTQQLSYAMQSAEMEYLLLTKRFAKTETTIIWTVVRAIVKSKTDSIVLASFQRGLAIAHTRFLLILQSIIW